MAADLGKLFGRDSVAGQLVTWQVLGQALAAVLAPEFELLTREVNKLLPSTPLSPAALADMVVRNIVDHAQAASYARESGVAEADFARMVQSAGEPPSPQELAEALRRGLIPKDGLGPDQVSYRQGVAEGRTYTKWGDTYLGLSVREPTPEDALNALLQGQLPMDQARDLYVRFGGDLEHFQWLFDSRGSAPTPLELIEMANRGVIPWDGEGPDVVSYHQGFLEGPWRNKWEEPYRKVGQYVPPPRTVTALIHSGAITDAQALTYFQAQGMTAELAAAYVADAHRQRTAATRALTTSEIEQAYIDRLLDQATASAMLQGLGDSEHDATLRLEMADFRRARAIVDQLVTKIRTLYVARKMSKTAAMAALDSVGVPPAQRDELLSVWDIEQQSQVQQLTTAEVCDAVKYGIVSADDALNRLVAMGWAPDEALIRLSVTLHGLPQTTTPPAGG